MLQEAEPALPVGRGNIRLSEPSVPRETLLKRRFRFPTPGMDEVVRVFGLFHDAVSPLYLGDGHWHTPSQYPLSVRDSASIAVSYINAALFTGVPAYMVRAEECLRAIAERQRDNGAFPCYVRSARGVSDDILGIVETASAGKALLRGFEVTNNHDYFTYIRAAADWLMARPTSARSLYNASAIGFLASMGEQSHLERALELAVDGVLPYQLLCGGWPESDLWMWNHAEIVSSLTALRCAVDSNHPVGLSLDGAITAGVNRIMLLQAPSGEALPAPKYRRRGYVGAEAVEALRSASIVLGANAEIIYHGSVLNALRHISEEWGDATAVEKPAKSAFARHESSPGLHGDPVWNADFSRFVKDAEWGEVIPDAFACGDLRFVVCKANHDAQEVVISGRSSIGGIGWILPRGYARPGRHCRLSAVMRSSLPPSDRLSVMGVSLSNGKKPDSGDPVSGCEFSQEEPVFGGYTLIDLDFVSGNDSIVIYAWGMTGDDGEPASITIHDVKLIDFGQFPRAVSARGGGVDMVQAFKALGSCFIPR